MSNGVVELENITKVYILGEIDVRALNGVDFRVKSGEFIAIMGPSGSGKSTMLHIIGCLDRPTTGRVCIEETDTSTLNDSQLARIRGRKIGFVFQFFNLYPTLNALENVELPMTILGMEKAVRREKTEVLLSSVGLRERAGHFPSQLSGGERQRVAIARALANDPALILADEPTGNLDSKSGKEILGIFQKLHDQGRTIIMVTHEEYVSNMAERTIKMRDGLVEDDS
ncbi:MAG: ABC transporter ATP-binding protein [Candidatus Hydrothermarchaeota archaeon]|nr:ABC transporter ATP-binding protein [Candidatus Hydrothermarchaeota archaeon]